MKLIQYSCPGSSLLMEVFHWQIILTSEGRGPGFLGWPLIRFVNTEICIIEFYPWRLWGNSLIVTNSWTTVDITHQISFRFLKSTVSFNYTFMVVTVFVIIIIIILIKFLVVYNVDHPPLSGHSGYASKMSWLICLWRCSSSYGCTGPHGLIIPSYFPERCRT